MSCNNPQTIEQRIICAETCKTRFNDNPIASFAFEDFVLYDESTYFDSGSVDNREIRWLIYSSGFLIYDFGFNKYFDAVSELSNGSVYSILNLGNKNADILSFIESLPNTIVPKNTKFELYLQVKDNTGISSNNLSNKYCFSK